MKYKALFLDVDGTTVVHGVDNIPSPRVTQMVKRAMQAGISVSLATSRPPRSVIYVIEHLGLNGICVLSSGAQIYDPKSKKVIIKKEFPLSALREIVDAAKTHSAQLSIYDGEKEFIYDGNNLPKEVLGMYFPKLEPDVLQDVTRELAGVSGIALHRMEAWEKGFECLDIVNAEASKLHGVVEVSRITGIKTHEIIGVGDGYNDFPLLLACGLKVAMGNAVPELKEIADFVAPPVTQDGVATVIEKYILS